MNDVTSVTKYLLSQISSYVFDTSKESNNFRFIERVLAQEILWTKVFLENLQTQLFVDTAEGFFLDEIAKKKGVIRTTETDEQLRRQIQLNSNKRKINGDINSLIDKIAIITDSDKTDIKVLTKEIDSTVPTGEMYIEIQTDKTIELEGLLNKMMDAGKTLIRVDKFAKDTFRFTSDVSKGKIYGFNHGKFGSGINEGKIEPPKIIAAPVAEILGANENDVKNIFGKYGNNDKSVITDFTSASEKDIKNMFGIIGGNDEHKKVSLGSIATDSEIVDLFNKNIVLAANENDISELFGKNGDSEDVRVLTTLSATEKDINSLFGDSSGSDASSHVSTENIATDSDIIKIFNGGN